METAITNASDTPALETLYTYTEQSDGGRNKTIRRTTNIGDLMSLIIPANTLAVGGYEVANSLSLIVVVQIV